MVQAQISFVLCMHNTNHFYFRNILKAVRCSYLVSQIIFELNFQMSLKDWHIDFILSISIHIQLR